MLVCASVCEREGKGEGEVNTVEYNARASSMRGLWCDFSFVKVLRMHLLVVYTYILCTSCTVFLVHYMYTACIPHICTVFVQKHCV